MDIKVSASRRNLKKWHVAIAAVVLTIGFTVYFYLQPAANSKINATQLWLGQVRQGDLTLEVAGFGVLESKVQRFLTAPYAAVIEEIVLRPGAIVTPDSVILKMSNPEISQGGIHAELALNTQKGVLKHLILAQEKERMEANNAQSELMSDLEVVKAKLKSLTAVAKLGAVSQLTLLETQAEFDKLTVRLANSKKMLAQLEGLHQQSRQIQQEQIDEKISLLELAKEQQSRLAVRAGIHGVLQGLPVELGQSVTAGDQLALVGGTDELIAVVQVPQRDVHGMEAGMAATIDTRGGGAEGLVRRIDPVVKEGNVEVEINLIGKLPLNARPSMNVEAKIKLGELKNALYIKSPVNSAQNSKQQIFKVNTKDQTAQLAWLEFGAKSGEFIQIKSGAEINDSFILSDMRNFAEQPLIKIN
ncbi:MAG: HlyD family efflux transporter periplasmic adaptor subunit [Gammaproteobacteria bacterium]|nr:HlyD family efflux transporter periplasmic adaptor subunit [Gammaproteobacteria bacterium]MBU2058198.1 HlyD family efflux transporter periplasmic adaptor subunit [Gammaproteobacteria bacterium]MBU2176971.1 HlyD family efflux transporter periplasmic adaptor subunit [Gammaproteobacteria bacterium]MBU2246584.1 HlyD family efflux transporter periplasmic adaptor subunit [Gammaproteobacteria bacterium]MBU2344955.1 HlyD family efflux transporter periplasmic adaptor subunit [Gammaproteobacteria bact